MAVDRRTRMRGVGTKRRNANGAGTVQSIFVRRVTRWANDVALSLPEPVLAEALASPTMRGSLATVLQQFSEAEEGPAIEKLFHDALSRGVAAKKELRQKAGGFKPTSWVAAHLGISRQAVDKRRRAGKLLAIEEQKGTFAYPLIQFTDDGILPGLEEALAAFRVESPWERLAALVNPAPALAGASLADVLRHARVSTERERAIAVAREFLQ
jgi:hypothetical protein